VFSTPRTVYGMLDGRMTITDVLERMLKEGIEALVWHFCARTEENYETSVSG